jgi:hypothetical protein
VTATTAYQQLWGIVEGAVEDAFGSHPDYLTPKGRRNAKVSVTKRVTGTVLSFAEHSARGLREEADKASEVAPSAPAELATSSAAAGVFVSSAEDFDPHCRIGKITPKRYSRYRVNNLFAKTTLALRRKSQSQESRNGR